MATTPLHEQAQAPQHPPRCLGVALVIRPAGLLRVVEQILGQRPDLRIVGRFGVTRQFADRLAELQPQLIVASVRSLGREHAVIAARLRRSSPGSKLILIHPVSVFPCEATGPQWHLTEDALVRGLIPAVERLAGDGAGSVAIADAWGIVS